jgi:adenosine deaminase
LAASDPELVAHLAERNVCLDICPSSNYLLSVVPSLDEHPLKQLLAAGVPCTINSDDPLLFGSSLLQEYAICRSTLKLSDEELADCAKSSFVHSHAPDGLKKRGIDGVAAWVGQRGGGL